MDANFRNIHIVPKMFRILITTNLSFGYVLPLLIMVFQDLDIYLSFIKIRSLINPFENTY